MIEELTTRVVYYVIVFALGNTNNEHARSRPTHSSDISILRQNLIIKQSTSVNSVNLFLSVSLNKFYLWFLKLLDQFCKHLNESQIFRHKKSDHNFLNLLTSLESKSFFVGIWSVIYFQTHKISQNCSFSKEAFH